MWYMIKWKKVKSVSLESPHISGRAGAVGYRRSGGLRSTPAALLPRHRRHPHVLLHRWANKSGQIFGLGWLIWLLWNWQRWLSRCAPLELWNITDQIQPNLTIRPYKPPCAYPRSWNNLKVGQKKLFYPSFTTRGSKCHFHPCRLARLPGEHPREVDSRGEALLPQCPHHPCRKQKGEHVISAGSWLIKVWLQYSVQIWWKRVGLTTDWFTTCFPEPNTISHPSMLYRVMSSEPELTAMNWHFPLSYCNF